MKKPPKQVTEISDQRLYYILQIEKEKTWQQIYFNGFRTFQKALSVTMWMFIAWTAKGALDSLAGRETIANIVVQVFANLKVNEWLAWAMTGGSAWAWRRERKMRKRKVKELTEKTAKLEALVDPLRESSNITRDGNTNPEDTL